MADGFADAQAVLGGITASWLDKSAVPIVISDVAMMLALLPDGGGFLEGFSFGFTCHEDDAPSAAKSGNQITVGSTTYRILKIQNSASHPLLNVYCGQVNQ